MAPLPAYTREASLGSAALLETEWLLTNGLGGFAMGTALGAPTRKYHALLVAATTPPVGRIAALNGMVERVVVDPGTDGEEAFELSVFQFRGGAPAASPALVRFEKVGGACRWVYRCGDVGVTKEVVLTRGRNAVEVAYTLTPAENGAAARERRVRLTLRPLVGMRDYHGNLKAGGSAGRFRVSETAGGASVSAGGEAMSLDGPGFARDEQWWYNFEYAQERARGLDDAEDLFSPGVFAWEGEVGRGGVTVRVRAWLGGAGERPASPNGEMERRELSARIRETVARAGAAGADRSWEREAVAALVAAADDFVVRRGTPPPGAHGERRSGVSVIAGYPWFSDWGRDTFVSLPGLFLVAGRYDEARRALGAFAAHCRRGVIPNRFDDDTGGAHYNTVDASLWFIHAACEYLAATGDRAGFNDTIGPACLSIVEHYRAGTVAGEDGEEPGVIAMDPEDGLIAAGNASTQLTWMDARRDGIVFTPRHGKAVEINALWYHALLALAGAVAPEDAGKAAELRSLARLVGRSLRAKFFDARLGCLYDRLVVSNGVWVDVPEVRPNQVFAVSLAHSALSADEQRAVVETVRRRLWTPMGLRTLDPADPGYRGRFEGDLFRRDGAYHNGTAWPWLLGPFAEAVLRVGEFSESARREARGIVRPLVEAMRGAGAGGGCVGQIAEVYDGDHTAERPQRPGGCPAQAWSVAEALRVIVLAGGT